MGSADERRRYNVTSSLIGWAHILTGPCLSMYKNVVHIFDDLGHNGPTSSSLLIHGGDYQHHHLYTKDFFKSQFFKHVSILYANKYVSDFSAW